MNRVAYLPFFERCWLPGIQALKLQWIELFEYGVDVTEENLPIILDELNQLKNWTAIKLNEADKEYLFENVNPLTEELPLLFSVKMLLLSLDEMVLVTSQSKLQLYLNC
ncbi:hypothetical protein [Paenibacillus sp. DMB5]|uniref:hypothetical protein n=1 Tax=Paenibacillus sp. DMB5 TaxID=1780103 RepID=UPI0018E2EA3C|nr:hypothetical protein [Paenibacillus sp. DMB5]